MKSSRAIKSCIVRYGSLWLLMVTAGVAAPSNAIGDDATRVLFLTQSKGFTHSVVRRQERTRSFAEIAMMQLAKDSGEFTVYCTQDAAVDVTRQRLQDFEIVMLYTTGKLPIGKDDLDYFLGEWLHQQGHGVIGVHSATDTFKDYEPYWGMIGGTFAGHPWGANTNVAITVHEPQHPTMRPFGERFEIRDEIYQYSHWQPEKVRVLMSLDMERCERKRPYHVPVAWCKQIGKGKLYYNNLGHRESTWEDDRYLQSILAAVRWIAGKEQGESAPNPDVSAAHHEHSVTHSHAAGVSLESLEAAKKQ